MKGSYKNRISTITLPLCTTLLFIFLTGCASLKTAHERTHIKIKGKKEILVARDLEGGQPFYVTGWCGNDAVLIRSEISGQVWLGLNGKRVTVSTKKSDFITGCTPDGKWVLYRDRDSSRIYRDRQGRLPEDIVEDGPGWHGFIADLYRFEVATGIRQKFAVVRDDSSALVSPDGMKVLLGNKHDYVMEDMPEPKWKKVWFTNEWTYYQTFWFADSSGIATALWGDASSIGVEFFGEDGWAKEYDLKQSVCYRKEGCSVTIDAVDRKKRIYLGTGEDLPVFKRIPMTKYHFFMCRITNGELVCEEAAALKEQEKKFAFIEMLPDGDIIFHEDGDNCIRRLTPGQTHARCIADTRYGNETYEDISMLAVSPDGKQMAFRRGKTPTNPNGRFYTYQFDLFVKELFED